MKKLIGIHRGIEPHWVGDGFPVRTVFSYPAFGPSISPFLMLDYAAPTEFPPANLRRGVGEHPHRGFETVTIVYQGELEHRDSAGNRGTIGPGDVQWMTAASGIVHEEWHGAEFTRTGGVLEMIQLWVNLPARDKMGLPGYQEIRDAQIPVATFDGGTARVVAGQFAGRTGPAHTFTPVSLLDFHLQAGSRVEIPLPDGHTTLLLVLHGSIRVNDTETISEVALGLFDRVGSGIVVDAPEAATVFLMTGEPIDEPVVGYGPFVMNTAEEIRQARADYQAGRMGRLDG